MNSKDKEPKEDSFWRGGSGENFPCSMQLGIQTLDDFNQVRPGIFDTLEMRFMRGSRMTM